MVEIVGMGLIECDAFRNTLCVKYSLQHIMPNQALATCVPAIHSAIFLVPTGTAAPAVGVSRRLLNDERRRRVVGSPHHQIQSSRNPASLGPFAALWNFGQ